ncbi:hypothetical protein CHS0354_019318 [Potamilus streckersoni]|uniref:Cns1/TTC4 wheel domain-containing protein n=1 Tax=Potamilus streckersoni TaxID=2493646 RepID=A0AAE0SHH5_9BIVA|nr:hypothetical protein CHS0354_019318 [Potamilus streckersoni]
MADKQGAFMSDEERQKLIEKLDADLEAYISEKTENAKKNKEPEKDKDIDEIVKELETHPAFIKEVDWSKPLSPEMEGLMSLKYEEEDPTARAEAYKEDGNFEFKKKKYSIAVENYTEGIKSKSPDKELNAVLYTNRAAAQYHLGNYKSSFQDCVIARKFKPDHLKAIMRDPQNKVILELRQSTEKMKRDIDRDRRKAQAQERKEHEEDLKLLKVIQSRGIQLAGMKSDDQGRQLDPSLLTSLEVHNPSKARVHLDADNVLHWPVLFLYPQYTETDYIEAFCEKQRFIDHLQDMFGPDVPPPPWDKEGTYTPDRLQVFYEDKEKVKLYKVKKEWTLLQCLQQKRYKVFGGTPTFLLFPSGTTFETEFLKRYET